MTHRIAALPLCLSQIMNMHRARWLENSLRRDLKIIDTSILTGLQHGAGFFASTALFAIGGCFALMGTADQVLDVLADIPFRISVDRAAFEPKGAGLIAIRAVLAGKHFNAGLRGIFMSLGHIVWFLGPVILLMATLLVILVLIRRQYFSAARAAVLDGLDPD